MLDLPGFGDTVKPHDIPDVAGLATWLHAWIDSVGIEQPSLLANSMGCQIAVNFAARRPDRVRRLELAGVVTPFLIH